MLTAIERANNYRDQRPSYGAKATLTPAQERRLRKKARRDLLVPHQQSLDELDPENDEQPSDFTFEVAGPEFSAVKGFDAQLAQVARKMLTRNWFRFRGDPELRTGIIERLKRYRASK